MNLGATVRITSCLYVNRIGRSPAAECARIGLLLLTILATAEICPSTYAQGASESKGTISLDQGFNMCVSASKSACGEMEAVFARNARECDVSSFRDLRAACLNVGEQACQEKFAKSLP